MAFTLGALAGIEGFTGLGRYENGDFEHSFEPREVIPESARKRAEAEAKRVRKELGVSSTQTLRELGYDDTQITEMQEEAQASADRLSEALMRNFDAGRTGSQEE